MCSSLVGTRKVVAESCSKLGTSIPHKRSNAEFEKEINVRAEVKIDTSKREDSGSKESRRRFTTEKVK